jgi:hypothetical protein
MSLARVFYYLLSAEEFTILRRGRSRVGVVTARAGVRAVF